MSLILFWFAAGLLIYTFVLFPVLIVLRGLLFHKPYKRADILPSVSVIIAAYNEEENIEARIKNVLSLDYPSQKLEVLIASDGSTDNTNEITLGYAKQGIKLLPLPRQGKQATLNNAISVTHGDILVFSDANSIFAPNAIRNLVQPFADIEVGGVAGNQTYLTKGVGGIVGESERRYWDFDQMLKKYQSQAGNVTSATGSIYAIRRSLFREVPPGVPDDFFISANVVAQGFRLVFAQEAVSYEPVSKSSGGEFSRKVRIISQGLYAISVMRVLLNPFRFKFYAIQLFSHKLLRRLMFVPLIILFVVSPFLWNYGLFFQLITLIQIGFYGMALLGIFLEGIPSVKLKLLTIPFYFCMIYLASLFAVFNLLRGHRFSAWDTKR